MIIGVSLNATTHRHTFPMQMSFQESVFELVLKIIIHLVISLFGNVSNVVLAYLSLPKVLIELVLHNVHQALLLIVFRRLALVTVL
jgi:hypothetical protein